MKSDNRIGDLLRNADVLAACGALILLVGVTLFEVIMRYCLGGLFVWQEKMQLVLIIWVVLLGGRYAFVCGDHATIDVIAGMFPEEPQKLPSVLVVAAAVIVLCYAGYRGVWYIIQMVRYDRVTNILKIPYNLTYAPPPIGCPTMAVQACLNTYGDLTGKGEEV